MTSEIRTTAPTTLPVSVIEARKHLRVDMPDDDVEIYNMIARATDAAEAYTGRAFCDQTWTAYRDGFPYTIILNRRPIVSVTSIKYIDINGTQQTLSSAVYRVDTVNGRIQPAYGQTWPNYRAVTNAVEVAYVAGYSTSQSPVGVVPEGIKQAILLLVASWMENKEDTVKGTAARELPGEAGATALLNQYRVYAI